MCPDGQVRLHPACLGSSAVKDLISGPSGPSVCCCSTPGSVSADHKMLAAERVFTTRVERVGLDRSLLAIIENTVSLNLVAVSDELLFT